MTKTKTLLISSLCLYGLLWNFRAFPNSQCCISDAISWVGYLLRIDQDWNLFAPYPSKESGWYEISGLTADGHSVSIISASDSLAFTTEPNQVWQHEFADSHWASYYIQVYDNYFALIPTMAAYHCRSWAKENLESLQEVKVEFVQKRAKLPPLKHQYTRTSFGVFPCENSAKTMNLSLRQHY